jgi:hypothetical protein
VVNRVHQFLRVLATALTTCIETKKQRSMKDPALVMFFVAVDITRRQSWRQALILKHTRRSKKPQETLFLRSISIKNLIR